MNLDDALRIARALRDNYALESATPVDVGVGVGIAPTSGSFRTLTGASSAYGLTTGSYNSQQIELTDLGRRIVAPTEEGDDVVAMREAFERPTVIGQFVEKYNGSKLPNNTDVVRNVLNGMGVPRDKADRVFEQLLEDMTRLGYLKELNGAKFVQRPSGAALPVELDTDDTNDSGEALEETETAVSSNGDHTVAETDEETPTDSGRSTPPRPNAIFLGHGKNRKPLEQLIKILDEYGIPHKEAVAEPNAGRPIPTKVAETMRDCGAAILIFSADEQFFDGDGNELWRPSENVVHELGAASVLYDNRIIIFKEDAVSLASNFSSIGYISFEKDKLSDKGIELFRELVSFKIINISVGN